MRELYGLMNLLDPDRWDDEDEFFDAFGGRPGTTSTPEQIYKLRVGLPCTVTMQGRAWRSRAPASLLTPLHACTAVHSKPGLLQGGGCCCTWCHLAVCACAQALTSGPAGCVT